MQYKFILYYFSTVTSQYANVASQPRYQQLGSPLYILHNHSKVYYELPPTYDLAPCHTAQGSSTALMLYFISTTFFSSKNRFKNLIRTHLILPRAAVK